MKRNDTGLLPNLVIRGRNFGGDTEPSHQQQPRRELFHNSILPRSLSRDCLRAHSVKSRSSDSLHESSISSNKNVDSADSFRFHIQTRRSRPVQLNDQKSQNITKSYKAFTAAHYHPNAELQRRASIPSQPNPSSFKTPTNQTTKSVSDESFSGRKGELVAQFDDWALRRRRFSLNRQNACDDSETTRDNHKNKEQCTKAFFAKIENGDVLRLSGSEYVLKVLMYRTSWLSRQFDRIKQLSFEHIEFNRIAPSLKSIRTKLPNLQCVTFISNGVDMYDQLKAFADLGNINEISISHDGNDVILLPFWRLRLIYYTLGATVHLINGAEVTEDERMTSLAAFGNEIPDDEMTSSDAFVNQDSVSDTNPSSNLESIEHEICFGLNSCENEPGLGLRLTEINSGVEQSKLENRDFAEEYAVFIIGNSVKQVAKKKRFVGIWPRLLTGLIEDVMCEFNDIDETMQRALKSFLEEVET